MSSSNPTRLAALADRNTGHRPARTAPGRLGCKRLRFEPLEQRRLLDSALGGQALEILEASPAVFVENQGQWRDASVHYALFGSGANVLHTDRGPRIELFQPAAVEDWTQHDGPTDTVQRLREGGLAANPDARVGVSFGGARAVQPVVRPSPSCASNLAAK